MKLRSHLVTLVISTLLPVLAFAGLMIFLFWRQQQALVEDRLLDTAQAMSLAVDREVIAWASALEALGTSKYLDSGDLRSFYDAAQRVLKTREDWNTILLADSAGRQLLNLFSPLGSPLPSVSDLEQFQQAIASARPVVSDLFVGRMSRKHLLGVTVPLMRNGKVAYVLAMSVPPQALLRILASQSAPPGWIGTIVDKKRIILATTRGGSELVGKPTSLGPDAQSDGSGETSWRAAGEGGVELRVVSHRSELAGWSVLLAIPVSVLEAPLRRSLVFIAVGGFGLLVAGIFLATVFGRRIAKPIANLSTSAAALGLGKVPEVEPSPIIEVNQVARQIQEAAVRRNDAQAGLDKVNEALQAEVAERTRAQQRIEALYEIARAINSTLDLRSVLDILAEKIFSFLPDSSGIIRLLNRETGGLDPAARWNFTPEEFDEFKGRKGGLSQAAFEAEEPLIIDDIQADPRTRDAEFARRNGIRRFIGFRLTAKGDKLGVLAFNMKGDREPTREEIEFLNTLANHAAIAIYNAQLHERLFDQSAVLIHTNDELHRHLDSLQALYRVASSLNEPFQAESVIHKAIREITAIFRFEATRVFVYDRAKNELHLFSSYEADPALWARLTVFRKGEGILGRVCDTGEPLVFEDVHDDPRYRELSRSRAADAAGFSFFAVYPVRSKAETLGAMVFLGKPPRRLKPHEDILIRSIAEQVGVTLENAELVRRLQHNLDRTGALHEVTLAVNSNVDLDSVLNVLFDQTGRLIPHAAAEIRLLNKETSVLEPTLCRNLNVEEWKAVRAGRGLARIVLESKAPLAIRDVQRDPRTANPEFMRREGIASFLGVPLIVLGEVIGCFMILTREEHDFAEQEIDLFSALASQAAVAIHKARLYQQVKKQADELSQANAELKRHTLEQGVVAHLGNLALGGLDIQSLMDEAVVLAAQTLDVEYTKVLELLPDRNALLLRAGVGWKDGLVGRATVGGEYESQAGYTLLSYEPVLVEDLSTETRFSGPALLREHGVVSGVSVVIYGKNGAYGVLGAHSTKRRAFTREQVAFVQAVANLLATAIERKQAEIELKSSRAQLRAFAASLQAAREAERTRVAREIHDELGQTLTGLKMDLSWLRKKLPKDQEVLLEKADAMLGLMNDSINAVRRISTELRPGVLDELGLAAAIEWQAREFEKRTGIRCGLDSSVNDGGLDKTRSTALFRIFQEALTNIARHANATRVRVRLEKNNGHLRLHVKDNGGGIRKSKLSDPQSLGLLGMRERATLVGGELAITGARGKGTTVTVEIPIAAEEQGSRGERENGN